MYRSLWYIRRSCLHLLPLFHIMSLSPNTTHHYLASSSLVSFGTYPSAYQLQIFKPIFSPVKTGNPACQLSVYPLPSLLIFSQYTAFPAIGLKTTPAFKSCFFLSASRLCVGEEEEEEFPAVVDNDEYVFSGSQSINRHQLLSLGFCKRGKCVPPPVQFASTYTMKELTRPDDRVAVFQS
jgi:hypothetical protein